MPYNALDKSARFVLPFGEHNIHSGNGKLVRYRYDAVGSELQATAQLALAEGVLNSVVKFSYDGYDIPAENYNFFKGAPAETAADPYFPTDVNHPGASFINFKLLPGMAESGAPDKTVGRFKCLEVENYNSSGTETAFGYSADPARAIAYGALKFFGNVNVIEFGAWAEYQAWCNEEIEITKDAAPINVPRFRLDYFFEPGITFKQFLDKITQLTCSSWQWRGGKVRLIPGADREVDMALGLSKLARDFRWQPIKNANRPNGVLVRWRDLDTELLEDAEPLIVRRSALITLDQGIENFIEFDAGNGYKDQIERFANYWAKVFCDFTDFAAVRGSFEAYPLLPEDIITIDHPTPNWTTKRCRVIKKEEKEDRDSASGIQTDRTGYEMFVRVEPINPYSDADFTPIVTKAPSNALNPYAAPPAGSLSISGAEEILQDGSRRVTVTGILTFGEFGFAQRGKVYWKKPGGAYEFLIDVTPDAENEASFIATNLIEGTHYFKVTAQSGLGVIQTEASEEDSIAITATDFIVSDLNGTAAIGSALNGLLPSGERVENDVAKVATADILPSIVRQTVLEDGETLDVRIGVEFATGATHNNASTVDSVEIDVFDQFGNLVDDNLPVAANSNGGLFSFIHDRKYADAIDGQSYYRIRVRNKYGWSAYVYLQSTSVTTTAPTAKVLANCPQDFTASAISESAIQGGYVFSANVDLYRRLPRETAWVKHNTSAITASPFTQSGLSAPKYEFQLRSTTVGTNRSNIIQVQMPLQAGAAPTYAAPTNPNGAVDATTPKSKLNFWCTSGANVATKVFVGGVEDGSSPLTAVPIGDPINFSISGLGEGVSKTVEFQHDHGGGNLSAKTAPVTKTTDTTPPSATKPTWVSGEFVGVDGEGSVTITIENHGGDGPFTYQRKVGTGGSVSTLNSNYSASLTTYEDLDILQGTSSISYYYRAKDNDIGSGEDAYFNWEEVVVPGYSPYCFIGWTQIWAANWWRATIYYLNIWLFGYLRFFGSLLNKRIDQVRVGDKVFAPDDEGNLQRVRVRRVFTYQVKRMLEVNFYGKDGSTIVRPSHPYRIEDGTYKPIADIIQDGDRILGYDRGVRVSRQILSSRELVGDFTVHDLQCNRIQAFVANDDDVHNKAE